MEASKLAMVLVACQTTSTQMGEINLPKSIAGITGLVSSPLESSINHLPLHNNSAITNHYVRYNSCKGNAVLINIPSLSFVIVLFLFLSPPWAKEKMSYLHGR